MSRLVPGKPGKAAHSYYDTATSILQVRCFALLDTSQVILLSLSASAPIQLTPPRAELLRVGRGGLRASKRTSSHATRFACVRIVRTK